MVSVGLYIIVPVILAQLLRAWLLAAGTAAFERAAARLGPYSIDALLLTLVLLFAFQGEPSSASPW